MNDLNNRIDESVTSQRTLLHEAILEGNKEAVYRLIIDPKCLEAMDGEGRRPLHFAAYKHDLEIIKALLNQRADIQATDSKGRKPIDYLFFKRRDFFLAKINSEEVKDPMEILLDFTSIVLPFLNKESKLLLQYLNTLKLPLLHIVVIIASILLAHLSWASSSDINASQFQNIIDGLIQGETIDQQDAYGRTALHYAVLFNCREMVARLCNLGANIDLEDNQSHSAFWYAADRNRKPFFETVNKVQKAKKETIDLSIPSCSNR